MKIYTKQGDQGQTQLVNGTRVPKTHLRIETYGSLDELNSMLGLLICHIKTEQSLSNLVERLLEIQAWLFQLGSQLACADPEMAKKLPTLSEKEIQSLEEQMDDWEKELPPLKNFILPGGHIAATQAHLCRTICRRVERLCVALDQEEKLQLPALAFLNRLSDYFFVLARIVNHKTGIQNIEWKA